MLSSRWLYIIAILLFGVQTSSKQNPYDLLHVPKHASDRTIRKAFHKRSLEAHPDRNQDDPEAEKKFRDIAWAYDILGNKTKRKIYDREQGMDPAGGGFSAGGGFQSGPFPFPGGFKFSSGGPHQFVFHSSSGGFPFGANPSFQEQQESQHRTPVDWFEDSPIDLMTSGLDLDDMNLYWPDVFFFFNRDDEETEVIARQLIVVANELNWFVEFQAVDCHHSPVICKEHRRTSGPYELQLLSKSDVSERPSKRTAKQSRSVLDASSELNSEAITQWILAKVPRLYTNIGSKVQFSKFLDKNAQINAPLVVFVGHPNSEIDLKFIKLAAENSKRLIFAAIRNTSSKSKYIEEFLTSIKSIIPRQIQHHFLMHIADPNLIKENTVEFLSLQESDFTIDLSLLKWVSSKKGNQGVYAVAATSMRELSADAVNILGVCGPQDTKYYFIYAREGGALRVKEHAILERAVRARNVDALRLMWIDSQKQKHLVEAFGISKTNKPALIVYRPKRGKYALFYSEGDHFEEDEVQSIIEKIIDGSYLLRHGTTLKKLPPVIP